MSAPPRVHFLEEQRRHRRTGAVSAALVVVVLAVSGIPLSVVISPLLLAVAAVPVYLADLVLDVPAEITGGLGRAFHLLPTTWSAVRRPDVDLPWDLLVGLFVLPGLIAMLLLWALVRLVFRRAGVGGVLHRLKTRPPRSDDLAEQRLVNLVHEVAVAAAVPPPRVLLIDAKKKTANIDGVPVRLVVIPVAHHLIHAPAVDDAGQLTHIVVEMAMELIAGPRQLRAVSSTGNIAIERLHHAESELPHVVAPP